MKFSNGPRIRYVSININYILKQINTGFDLLLSDFV
jgi:hypothetical protein